MKKSFDDIKDVKTLNVLDQDQLNAVKIGIEVDDIVDGV